MSQCKQKHNTLTLLQKNEILKRLDKADKLANLVNECGIGRATILDIQKNSEKIVQITRVDRVENSFLKAMYFLKKDEYLSRYETVEEMDLFHVTGVNNVKSIINNNFDWRRVSRGKFGIGTSFSDDAEYANRYANKNIGSNRAFIVTKVLVSNQIGGHKNLKIPQNNCDTTTGNGKVYVKFCDNETLPMYVAYYQIKGCTTKKKAHVVFDNDYDDDYSNGFDYDNFDNYYRPTYVDYDTYSDYY